MLRIHRFAGDAKGLTAGFQLLIESVFVGQEVFKSGKFSAFYELLHLGRKVLEVLGIIQGQVLNLMALLLERLRKVAHGQKKGNDFLNVVGHIVGLLPHF
jgi:hypothetical protein